MIDKQIWTQNMTSVPVKRHRGSRGEPGLTRDKRTGKGKKTPWGPVQYDVSPQFCY